MGKRLDDLSRQLASGVSRRQVLKGAVGGLAAAATATLLPGRTAAADDNCSTLACCQSFCTARFYTMHINATTITYQQDIAECVQACLQYAEYNEGPCAGCGNCEDNSLCLPTNYLYLNQTSLYLNQSAICVPLSSGNDNNQGNEDN